MKHSVQFDTFDLEHIERTLILLALLDAGSIVNAAPQVGIDRHALTRRVCKHEIEYPLPEDAAPPVLVKRGLIKLASLNLAAAERAVVAAALDKAGSITDAAQLLGITRHGVRRRVTKYQIQWVTTHTPKDDRP